MTYKNSFDNLILERGELKGYRYYIISRGMFPCAYVEIPKRHKLYKCSIDEATQELCVYGGITYAEPSLLIEDIELLNSWFLGWDYMHSFDRFGKNIHKGKSWTTEEILKDVQATIEQLAEEKKGDEGLWEKLLTKLKLKKKT